MAGKHFWPTARGPIPQTGSAKVRLKGNNGGHGDCLSGRYTLEGRITPTKRESRKIIDLNVPAGRGYVMLVSRGRVRIV